MPRANRLADCPAIAQEGPAGPISGGSSRCGSSGRNVLVTGGASGIGLAIAQEFCARGARVLVADRDRDGLARLPALLDPARLLTIEADLAEPGPPAGSVRRPSGCSAASTCSSTTPGSCARRRRWRSRSPSGTSCSPSTSAPSSSSPRRWPADGRARRRRRGVDRLGQRVPGRGARGPLQRDQGGHRLGDALVHDRARAPRGPLQLRRAGRDRRRRGGRGLHR